MDDWRPIEEFPDYMIEQSGAIYNQVTCHHVEPMINQRGILMVQVRDGHVRTSRSVAKLVLDTFGGQPEDEEFNTVMHLNGDKEDCHFRNLRWRPRHYAIKYHEQFRTGSWNRARASVMNLDDGNEFTTIQEAAMYYGVTILDIAHSASEGRPCPIVHQNFRVIAAA